MSLKKRNKKVINTKTNGVINNAGEVLEEKIITTLEKNYMPYAMSVIMSRAIPEIDGFKPSHRKLLYTMYKMGLLGSQRTKSANIVGQTMKLNPHGDSAIYDTMVRLSRGYEALLHPYIDSKGNFGKFYSRDMAYAASRYTEARLDDIAEELFLDIDKNAIDFVDNYDNTMKEPVLLPTRFPSVLVNSNVGIAVGMASSICSFNLKEVCETTICLIKNADHNVMETLIAPDFSGGGQIIYDSDIINQIYKTGKGSIKIRAKYNYDKIENCIDIVNIPATTSSESIIEKVIDLVKQGKLKEISDIRDETGIDGLKITIDLKRGIDSNKLMQRLYKMTPLEDTFYCNFNILISGVPQVIGIKEIIEEWILFRIECVKRRLNFDLDKKNNKLHLLKGLNSILLDIDKAIKIIRETDEETYVIPNLMAGFGIDKIQAEYVAEIKLRNLNKEYILKRTKEIEILKKEIENLYSILESDKKIKKIIEKELINISDNYGQSRKTMIIHSNEIDEIEEDKEISDYNVTLFLTKGGYFKKITPQSLRMSGEHKLKENDNIIQEIETSNVCDILFFTNSYNVYKSKISDFKDTKASLIGDYVPAKLSMDDGEYPICMVVTNDYEGYMIFFFSNGRIAKVSMKSYKTKTNRKKLVGAYCEKFNVVSIVYLKEDKEFLLTSTSSRKLLLHMNLIATKSTRVTQGIIVMKQRKGCKIKKVDEYTENMIKDPNRYRTTKIPSFGFLPKKNNSLLEQD